MLIIVVNHVTVQLTTSVIWSFETFYLFLSLLTYFSVPLSMFILFYVWGSILETAFLKTIWLLILFIQIFRAGLLVKFSCFNLSGNSSLTFYVGTDILNLLLLLTFLMFFHVQFILRYTKTILPAKLSLNIRASIIFLYS